MKTITWKFLYRTKGVFHVYAIKERHGEIIYIGMSDDAIGRLMAHIGDGKFNSSPTQVGEFILDHLPEASDWHIDLYTFLDCKRLAGKKSKHYDRQIVLDAEALMIIDHRPHFNVALNQIPRRLPSGYEKWERKGEDAVRRVFAAITSKMFSEVARR